MNEDFSTREWTDHHAKFSTDVTRILATIGQAMRVLNEKQFSAPWKSEKRDDCKAC